MNNLRNDVDSVVKQLVLDINPYDRTKDCLKNISFNTGKKILISVGKAAYDMAKAVSDNIEIDNGVVITKYGHSKGDINNIEIYEAGHPIVDENSIIASKRALEITDNLNDNDNVIMCISGGASALFEKPLISLEQLQDINNQLIRSGCSINEINTIRKRLSEVKGGRFSKHCSPAHIYAIILSDVIGNDLSSIGSGPVSADVTSSSQALKTIDKYNIAVTGDIKDLLKQETVKDVDNVDSYIIGSVEQLCDLTANKCSELGYKPVIIQNNCTDNVEDIANRFEDILKTNKQHNIAYIIGGESVVEVKGSGLGGRNSELALLCSKFVRDVDDVCIFTFGSDGTDGPTDAAGGYVDKNTYNLVNVEEYLKNNDSYHALEKTGGLIKTGPTGSNVNDVYVLLIR